MQAAAGLLLPYMRSRPQSSGTCSLGGQPFAEAIDPLQQLDRDPAGLMLYRDEKFDQYTVGQLAGRHWHMEWTQDADESIQKVPFFVRKRVRARVEKEAKEAGKKSSPWPMSKRPRPVIWPVWLPK